MTEVFLNPNKKKLDEATDIGLGTNKNSKFVGTE